MKDTASARRATLEERDPDIYNLIQQETEREEFGLEMIPSENFVSEAVLEALGSVCTNKYAEGYPGKRYYGGCQVVDQIESIALERATKLFGVEFANMQPHSGAQANEAAFQAVMNPGDVYMGLRLDQGGHLTHGSPVNFSGRLYKVIPYGVRQDDHLIDMDEVARLAREHKPKMILCGATAYSRVIDWKRFSEISAEVGATLVADIAHYAGLVAGGVYPSPAPFADIVTTTTHKTLRGPRSGMILGREKFHKPVNKAVFPGLQGGPHMHTIAAKAVMLKEAADPSFAKYAAAVVENARTLAKELASRGFDIITGGTDSHLLLVDMRPAGLNGKEAEAVLGQVGITVNKNTIPYDPLPPAVCSGIRLGTPALTTRGMGVKEMVRVADLMKKAVDCRENVTDLAAVHNEVKELAGGFPLYKHRLVK